MCTGQCPVCPKVHTQPIKRSSFGFNKGAIRQPRAPLAGGTGLSGVHRTVSGVPRGPQLKLFALGNSRKPARYNSPDMSGAPTNRGLRNSSSSGFHDSRSAIIHRTVRCAPDCPVCQRSNGSLRRQRLPAVHSLRAQRAQTSDAPTARIQRQ